MLVNKDQIKGRTQEARNKIKEVSGPLVNEGKLVTKGKIEKNPGKVQVTIYDTSMM